ncbi:MAG: hypothetical protein K2Y23_01280 [Cyanobacteria bacterium]|nr:hypothetical protein [Cyanobacteriota bacterium]
MLIDFLRRVRASKLVARDRILGSALDIVLWWEARRLLFNLLVGAAGVITCVGLVTIAVIGGYISGEPDFGFPDPPIFAILGVIAFGIMANVCYTGGWIVELIVRRAWPQESQQLATLSFTLGIILAVLVTLLPIPLFGLLVVLALLPVW